MPAASPAVPARAYPLAQVRVVKGTSTAIQASHITRRGLMQRLRGGRTAGPTVMRPTTPRMPGDTYYDTDIDALYEADNSLTWRKVGAPGSVYLDDINAVIAPNLPRRWASGRTGNNTTASGASNYLTINMPSEVVGELSRRARAILTRRRRS